MPSTGTFADILFSSSPVVQRVWKFGGTLTVEMKLKVKRACFRALGMSLILMTTGVMTTGMLQGSNLWNNGAVNPSSAGGQCDGPCGSVSGPVFTIFDNFTVGPSGVVITGFDYSDFFINTATTQYSSTQWSIWKGGDPVFGGGTLVATSSSVASLGPSNCNGGPQICLVQLTVSGISVKLTGGTYYLGIASMETGVATTLRALASGNGLSSFEQSNGSTTGVIGSTWIPGTLDQPFFATDTAFDVTGTVVPEPGTLTLMSLAIAGLCLVTGWRSKTKLPRSYHLDFSEL